MPLRTEVSFGGPRSDPCARQLSSPDVKGGLYRFECLIRGELVLFVKGLFIEGVNPRVQDATHHVPLAVGSGTPIDLASSRNMSILSMAYALALSVLHNFPQVHHSPDNRIRGQSPAFPPRSQRSAPQPGRYPTKPRRCCTSDSRSRPPCRER